MRIIIAGSRNHNNRNEIFRMLDEALESEVLKASHTIKKSDIEIISGGARGVDSIAIEWAKATSLRFIVIKANWHDMSQPCLKKFSFDGLPYNALAGFNRNKEMATYASLDEGRLWAIWDGKSPGTKHMIETARNIGLKFQIFYKGVNILS